jgi:hypothetical protein
VVPLHQRRKAAGWLLVLSAATAVPAMSLSTTALGATTTTHATPRGAGGTSATATPASDPTTTTSEGPTTTSEGPTTTGGVALPSCAEVLAGNVAGDAPLTKQIVGVEPDHLVVKITTARSAGSYTVRDCLQGLDPATGQDLIATVDLGRVTVAGNYQFQAPDSQFSNNGGDQVCDRVVLAGTEDGAPFTDVSDAQCTVFSGCSFVPPPCPPLPETTAGVAAGGTGTRGGGQLPFTGVATVPLLLVGLALVAVGAGSLSASRRWGPR